jgi:hypothetical protein
MSSVFAHVPFLKLLNGWVGTEGLYLKVFVSTSFLFPSVETKTCFNVNLNSNFTGSTKPAGPANN